MNLKRREFLKYVGVATASTAGAGWLLQSGSRSGSKSEAALFDSKPTGPGVERWVPSVCRLCPGGCGIRVRLVNDVPVRIEGNPHPPGHNRQTVEADSAPRVKQVFTSSMLLIVSSPLSSALEIVVLSIGKRSPGTRHLKQSLQSSALFVPQMQLRRLRFSMAQREEG